MVGTVRVRRGAGRFELERAVDQEALEPFARDGRFRFVVHLRLVLFVQVVLFLGETRRFERVLLSCVFPASVRLWDPLETLFLLRRERHSGGLTSKRCSSPGPASSFQPPAWTSSVQSASGARAFPFPFPLSGFFFFPSPPPEEEETTFDESSFIGSGGRGEL